MTEWISVDEKLPEIGSKVLTAHYYGPDNTPWIDIVRYDKYGERECFVCSDDEFFRVPYPEHITYWMPIPEPPQNVAD